MLDDYIGRQNWPIFAWQTTDFCLPILLADKINQLYRSFDIPLIRKDCSKIYISHYMHLIKVLININVFSYVCKAKQIMLSKFSVTGLLTVQQQWERVRHQGHDHSELAVMSVRWSCLCKSAKSVHTNMDNHITINTTATWAVTGLTICRYSPLGLDVVSCNSSSGCHNGGTPCQGSDTRVRTQRVFWGTPT